MDNQELYDLVTNHCKNSLKAPSTAVFCPIEDLKIKSQRSTKCPYADKGMNYRVFTDVDLHNEYIAEGYVDSQNSFGAMMRTPFLYRIREDTTTHLLSILDGAVGEDNIGSVYTDSKIKYTESEQREKETETDRQLKRNRFLLSIIACLGFLLFMICILESQ